MSPGRVSTNIVFLSMLREYIPISMGTGGLLQLGWFNKPHWIVCGYSV